MVWGISYSDSEATLSSFSDSLGITYPILHDLGGEVHDQWMMELSFPSALYPQDWIISPDGTVVYGNNAFEPDEMRVILDSYLEP